MNRAKRQYLETILLAALPLVLLACAENSQSVDEAVQADASKDAACMVCHGGVNGNAAPPFDLDGGSDTSRTGVGAHQAHLGNLQFSTPLSCQDCHLTPHTIGDVGHMSDNDGHAEVTFAGRGKMNGAHPAWDGARCNNVYCHGATLTGGNLTAPLWTAVDGTQAACGSCHGLPPPLPHPQNSDCHTCHSAVVDSVGAIIDKTLHINGQIDLNADLACNSCHGNATNPAPPTDLHGETATTNRGVGAHQSHLQNLQFSMPLACSDCHVTPASVDAPGHITDADTTAEVTFGTLATSHGVTPSWDGTRCNNVYCHGATLHGGAVNAPQWTQVDGTQAACGACHGLPPSLPHPQNPDCHQCHNAVVDAANQIIDKRLHINGTVEYNAVETCNSCHGNATNAAPPNDLQGSSDTNLPSVGAHQAHMLDSGLLLPVIACSECHQVPTHIGDAGHIDGDGHAEVTFSGRAIMNGVTPNWDGTRCNNVYCHGATIPGGQFTPPIWTLLDGTQGMCIACHGMPPHAPQHVTCDRCHWMVVDQYAHIINPALHINGVIDVDPDPDCSPCHEP